MSLAPTVTNSQSIRKISTQQQHRDVVLATAESPHPTASPASALQSISGVQPRGEDDERRASQPPLMINFNEQSTIETDGDEKEEEICISNTSGRRHSTSLKEEAEDLNTQKPTPNSPAAAALGGAALLTTPPPATTTTTASLNDIPTIDAPRIPATEQFSELDLSTTASDCSSVAKHPVPGADCADGLGALINEVTTITSTTSFGDDSARQKEPKASSKGQAGDDSAASLGAIGCDEDTISKSSDTSGEVVRGLADSSGGVEKSKSSSRLGDRAKKKSWYSVLYPNYKSRSQDFKKLFEVVPKDERLIVDYSCALQRDILVQGRLYVSQNYVCFHANIFRWETYLSVRWKDVTSITKEKTALVIPNAILICTATEKYFFATFASRDKAFLMLFRIWQNTLMNKQMPAHELWQWVHNCYGDELGLTSDDEDYIDPSSVLAPLGANDTGDCDLDFSTALSDSLTTSSSLNLNTGYSSEYSTAPSLAPSFGEVKEPKKAANNNSSKRKSYFFGGKEKRSTSTSGSDNNKASDCSSEKSPAAAMKTNAKELTLISAKPDEVPSGASATAAAVAATTTSNGMQVGTSSSGTGSGGAEGLTTSPSVRSERDSKSFGSSYDSKHRGQKTARSRDDSLIAKNSDPLPTDVSDSSDSDENKIPFVATAECNSLHEGRQLVHTILPINIETLFSFLFSKSKFLMDFHAMRKSTDLVFGDWVTTEDGRRTRTFNVTVQLAASVGPKTSRVTECQEMRDCSKPGELYSIDVNSVNAGIPYADSFCVLMHHCLVRTVDDHTMLSVHAQIKYKKSIWGVVKGFIEKNTWAGLEDFYSSLLHSLQSETCIPPAKGKGRRPRRGTAAQIRPADDTPVAQTKLLEASENTPRPAAGSIPANIPSSPKAASAQEHRGKHKWLSVFVLLLLCFLIVLNVVLLLKLWKLEERINEDISQRARLPNLSRLKQLPSNHEDWIELLRQQEILHETELKKWHKVLQTAIELLKKTEKTLAELMFR